MISYNGKHIREAKGKFTQYKITHRFNWTPSRLNRMGLINSNLSWKCRRDIGTFSHCIWECPVIQPFWRTILEYLSNWLGKTLPVSPRLSLLGDRTQIHNISDREFSVVMVSTTVATGIILRHWKKAKIYWTKRMGKYDEENSFLWPYAQQDKWRTQPKSINVGSFWISHCLINLPYEHYHMLLNVF